MTKAYAMKPENLAKRSSVGAIAEALFEQVKDNGPLLAHAFKCGRLFKGTAEDEELLKKIYDTVHLATHI